jgi:Tfp pilus assembly protein PilV
MTGRSIRSRRRGSLLVEVAMAAVLLMIAMTLTVKVIGLVALERRGSERRQRALLEVANVMERITAHPFDEVTPELAGRLTLSPSARQSLPDSELKIDVAASEPGPGRSARRIAIKLRWRGPDGEWVAPVRLTSWIERRRQGS